MVKIIPTIKSVRMVMCVMLALAVAFAYTAEPSFAAVPKATGVKAKVVANKTVRVSWSKKAAVDGYKVYVATSKRGKYKAKATVNGDQKSANVKKLKLGKTYWFKVRTFEYTENGKAYGSYSKRVKCVITPAPPKLTAASVKYTKNTIRIKFSKSTGARGYQVYRAPSKGGKYKKIKTLSAKTRTFKDTKIKANKAYYYKVRAFTKKRGKKVYGGFSSVVEEISGGNSHQYDLNKVPVDKSSSLKDRKILFLGSSITLGLGSMTSGVAGDYISFVDYLAKKDGIKAQKEAVSGTTISRTEGSEGQNYVDRLRNVGPDPDRKLVVCQLSTNDARYTVDSISKNGREVSDKGVDNLDTLYERAHTVEGAIDFIAVYSKKELGCDVVFYVVPPFVSDGKFNAEDYTEHKSRLLDVQKDRAGTEYEFDIINMWDDESFKDFRYSNARSQKRAFYMKDAVHPTKAGYLLKFVPVFQNYLKNH